MEANDVLNILLVFFGLIVLFFVGLKVLMWYFKHKLTKDIIKAYGKIPKFSRHDVQRMRKIIKDSEAFVPLNVQAVAITLLDIREEILDAQEKVKD